MTARDERGRFVKSPPPPTVRRARRRIRLPYEWGYSLCAAALAVALGLAIGRCV